MENRVVFIAKTDLNVDGRILNQIKILFEAGILNHTLDFILLPDKPYNRFLSRVTVHELYSRFRRNSALRALTVLDTTIKGVKLLFRLKPDILHVQDTAVVLPALIYRYFKGRSFKLIYDDHELPNENESLQYRVYQYFEKLLMKKSDLVLFANEERMQLVVDQIKTKVKVDYFLNLPYFDEDNVKIDESIALRFTDLENEINSGVKLIMHQGSLEVERGRKKLADFSRIVPAGYKILIVGVEFEQFNKFIKEYMLDLSKFYFFGTVAYRLLDIIWSKCIGSIVMYLPTYINNRLCAPNRMYISLKHGLPVIINKENPVLRTTLTALNCGFFIEEFTSEQFVNLEKRQVFSEQLDMLKRENKKKLIKLYKELE